MLAGRGAISRVTLDADGKLKVESPRFIEGLNSPLGIAVLTAPSGPFPAGTLVVSAGASFTVDGDERALPDDEARGTGLVFFDSGSGKELGRVFLGHGSPAPTMLGHPIADPTGVVSDTAGNIYLADVGGAEGRPLSQIEERPGVIKFTPAAIEALAKREAPPAGSIAFALVVNIPSGLAYAPGENAIYWGTSNGMGEIFRAPKGDFSAGAALETVARETNSLSGLGVTPNGSVIAGRNEGDIVVWRAGSRARVRPVRFPDEIRFLLPGQIASTKLADGRVLVVVPELSGGGRGPWHQRLQVFTLPSDY
jgi:hypothetical protein